jgi:hypothetical protein
MPFVPPPVFLPSTSACVPPLAPYVPPSSSSPVAAIDQGGSHAYRADATGEVYYFSHLLTLKLTAENYFLWHTQVLPHLRNHYLEGFVDGSQPCPPATVTMTSATGTHVFVVNPAHLHWISKDQAILGALQSSLKSSVAGLVVFAATTREVWATLESSFSSQSSAHAMAIRN